MKCIEIVLKRLEDGQRIEIADVTVVLKFLRLFGDQYHQVMEEEVLFPALLNAAPGETALCQLVSDHGSEQKLIVEIEQTLMSRRGMAFFRSARHLTALLQQHCDKEEAILSELAECLSQDEDQAIATEFMKFRTPGEIYSKFPRLEQKYLPTPISTPASPVAESARARAANSYG